MMKDQYIPGYAGSNGEVLIYRIVRRNNVAKAEFILTEAGEKWLAEAYESNMPMPQIEQTLGISREVRKRMQHKLGLKSRNRSNADKASNKYVTRTRLKNGELIYSEEGNKFIADNMNNMTLAEMAQEMNVHPSSIRYQIRRLGLRRQFNRPAPQPLRKVTPEMLEYIKQHRAETTLNELCARLHISKSTMQKVVKKHNIVKPKHSKPMRVKSDKSITQPKEKIGGLLTEKERRVMKLQRRYYTENDYHVGNELTQLGKDFLLKNYSRMGWARLVKEMGCSHQYLTFWLDQLGIKKKQDGPKPHVIRKVKNKYRIEVSKGTKMVASFMTDDPERINKYKQAYKNYDIKLIEL